MPYPNPWQPYPLSWAEQQLLFSELPTHLAEMALFAVNTGCRDAEICRLQWDWEVKVPTLDTFVLIVPGSFVENGDERLVVLNDIAKRVVDTRRGKHPTYVSKLIEAANTVCERNGNRPELVVLRRLNVS
jgi:integrase